jgi:hypothetical protein
MSDKHLERKEVLNLVYTRQADRMADAYARLMADFSQMTAWGRGLESDLSWARAELMQVKAELERLTAFTTRTIIPNEELQAQVERLTKAGDALANNIVWVELYRPLVAKWNAAKEGKQP